MSELQVHVLQNNTAKVLLGLPIRSSSSQALKSLDFEPLALRRFFHHCTTIHKCLIGSTGFDFSFIRNQAVYSHNARQLNNLHLPLPHTNWGKQLFIYQAAKDWNSLPRKLKDTHLLSIFKAKLKTFLNDFS